MLTRKFCSVPDQAVVRPYPDPPPGPPDHPCKIRNSVMVVFQPAPYTSQHYVDEFLQEQSIPTRI